MGIRKLQVLPWERYFLGFPLRSLRDDMASHTPQALNLTCGILGNAKGQERASDLLRTRKPQPHSASSASSAPCPLALEHRTVCRRGVRLAAVGTVYEGTQLPPEGRCPAQLAWVGLLRSGRPHLLAQVQELVP